MELSRLRHCRYACALAAALLLAPLAWVPWVKALDFERLQAVLLARFDSSQAGVLRRLESTLQRAVGRDEEDKLEDLNDFFNFYIRFDDDRRIWQQDDYWATPIETIGRGLGDCEDIAIAKYFALAAAGVPVAKLRLVYVRATIQSFNGPAQQAHMVLAYYPTPNGEPLILDNLDTRIRPASQRSDLQPVFSFNSEAVWSGSSASTRGDSGGVGQLTRWSDLLLRNRAEGFE